MLNLNDPVLRLLPSDPPDSFAALSPEEQAWRGRTWLILYGAGYEPDHAWGLALQVDDEWERSCREIQGRVTDRDYPFMLQARLTFEASKQAIPADAVH